MCPSNKRDWSDEASVIVVQAQSRVVTSEWRCIVVDRQCRESEEEAKIEGYMSISDEAHQWLFVPHQFHLILPLIHLPLLSWYLVHQ